MLRAWLTPGRTVNLKGPELPAACRSRGNDFHFQVQKCILPTLQQQMYKWGSDGTLLPFIWVSYDKPSSDFTRCVMCYFWWRSQLSTLGSGCQNGPFVLLRFQFCAVLCLSLVVTLMLILFTGDTSMRTVGTGKHHYISFTFHVIFRTLTLSLPNSKSTFSQPLKEKMYKWGSKYL